MINITYKLTNLYLKLINLTIKKQPLCKKMKEKKKDHLLSQSVKKAIYYKYSFLSTIINQ